MRVVLLLLLCTAARAACPPTGTRVLVDVTARRMELCRDGRADRSYRVSLGRGGLDKRREGDGKTPLGEYPLSPGRPSREFHTFLAVGYPTAAQRAAGLSGGDIGIHGPKRGLRWLGRLAMLSNWTRGCIAVGSDEEIRQVDEWVRTHHARVISLRR
jgi:murein L,D-transpeptidase YafK